MTLAIPLTEGDFEGLKLPWDDQRLLARFWGKVEKSDGCWIWTGAKYVSGHGQIRIRERLYCAHRLSLEIHLQRFLSATENALHSCRSPACIKPEHLRPGSHADNMRDAVRDGTNANVKKTHCPRGHPYDMRIGAARSCRRCHREAIRRCGERRKAGLVDARGRGRPKLYICPHDHEHDYTDCYGYVRCSRCIYERRKARAAAKRDGIPTVKPLI